MKADPNMETDRLLRRFAQRGPVTPGKGEKAENAFQATSDMENQAGTSHLDADELSAFAENALPATTRLRYMRHLSDCDSCRKLVTGLALSSGVVAKLEPVTTVPATSSSSTWRDRLAVIFAPRVLRYAASLVLLIGIATIAFVVYQSGMGRRFSEGSAPSENSSVEKTTGGSTNTTTGSNPDSRIVDQRGAAPIDDTAKRAVERGLVTPTPTDTPSDLPREAQKVGQEQGQSNPPPPPAKTDDSVFGEPGVSRDKDAAIAEKRQPATGLDKAKAKKEADVTDSTSQLSTETIARKEAEENVSNEGAAMSQSKSSGARAAKPPASARARSNTAGPAKAPAAAAADEDRKARTDSGRSEATSVVGGKQFVRRDGAWVDVTYRSQATTNVKRGSDQYRALVADEPGLRTIANQLSGVVVVVWNGRAYRIN